MPEPRERKIGATPTFIAPADANTKLNPLTRDSESSLHRPLPVIPGYDVIAKIGQGGMGVVYRAKQLALDRFVALKMIRASNAPESLAERFEREARTVAKLRHPNIVTAFDFGRKGEDWYFVMELLDGEPLDARLARPESLDEATAWSIIRQAVAGLAHAAEQGIIHRDIKPANLYLVPAPLGLGLPAGVPMVKVMDFGLARLIEADPSSVLQTAPGSVLGTPMYMAPEQLEGLAVDLRADIYALGATAYHLITGKAPFAPGTAIEILFQRSRGIIPEVPAHISPASTWLLKAMLEPNRDRRLKTYEELLDRIDAILGNPTVAAVRHSRRWHSPAVRKRWIAAAVLGLAIVAAGIGTYFVTRPGKKTETLQPITMRATGRVEGLFDGKSINGWQNLKGLWTPAANAENAGVLSGQSGVVRRSLPEWANYRLYVSVDLHKASAVELHFGLTRAESGSPRYVLRVAPSEGIVVGRRPSDAGPLETLTQTKPYPRAEDLAVRAPYLALRVERQPGQWAVSFEGEVIALIPGDEAVLPEFRLVVEGGPAHFETIEAAELTPQ